MAKLCQCRKKGFEKLFNSQLSTLKDRGVSDKILKKLQGQERAVIKKAGALKIVEGHIPFIPVIKPQRLHYDVLMSLVRNRSVSGVNCLTPSEIKNKVKTPANLYFIYDIENGQSTLGLSPLNAEKSFRKDKRFGLNVAETIALTIHTDTLSHYYLWATGSRYRSRNEVPHVWLNGGGPRLYYMYSGSANDQWGSPSCGSR